MDGSPQVEAERAAWSSVRGRRPRWRWAAPGAAAAVLLLLFAPLIVATPWSPTLRWTCQPAGVAASGTFYAPLLIANAPYGGTVWANGSWTGKAASPTFGLVATNGSAEGLFAPLALELYHVRNATVFGPGPSHRCGARYAVGVGANGPFNATPFAPQLLGAGNRSDLAEPTVVDGPHALWASVTFDNGFRAPGTGSVSTCLPRGADAAAYAQSTHRIVFVPFLVDARVVFVRAVLPISENFHYHFPGQAGYWAVRDLRSGPGAPGGGWAFSYGACSTPGLARSVHGSSSAWLARSDG
jgi:hypothetical protein